MNILIVDDNYDFRLTVEEYFKSCGHKTTNASNGLEALNILDVTPVEVAILDLSMPAMNGYETLDYISVHYPKTSVVIITGKRKLNQVELLKNGALFVEKKPLDMVELELKVRNFCMAVERVQSVTIPYQTVIEMDINRVYHLILDEIDNYHLNVDYLASFLNYNKKQFYERVQDLLTISAHEMIKYLRLLKASEIIRNNEVRTVREVSHRVGYQDSGYFARLYREYFGENPRELLKKNKPGHRVVR